MTIKSISFDLDDTLWPLMPSIMEAEKTTNKWIKENFPGTAALFGKQDVIEIRDKLISEGYHMPISWETEKSAIIYNNKEQDKYANNS